MCIACACIVAEPPLVKGMLSVSQCLKDKTVHMFFMFHVDVLCMHVARSVLCG